MLPRNSEAARMDAYEVECVRSVSLNGGRAGFGLSVRRAAQCSLLVVFRALNWRVVVFWTLNSESGSVGPLGCVSGSRLESGCVLDSQLGEVAFRALDWGVAVSWTLNSEMLRFGLSVGEWLRFGLSIFGERVRGACWLRCCLVGLLVVLK